MFQKGKHWVNEKSEVSNIVADVFLRWPYVAQVEAEKLTFIVIDFNFNNRINVKQKALDMVIQSLLLHTLRNTAPSEPQSV